MTSIMSIPSITIMVYIIMEIFKQVFAYKKPKLKRFIPLIAGLSGVALGILSHYFAGNTIPSDNIMTAIFIGGASGLAATGTNQIIRQFSTDEDNKLEQ